MSDNRHLVIFRQSHPIARRHLYLLMCVDRRVAEIGRRLAKLFMEGFPGMVCLVISPKVVD